MKRGHERNGGGGDGVGWTRGHERKGGWGGVDDRRSGSRRCTHLFWIVAPADVWRRVCRRDAISLLRDKTRTLMQQANAS